MAEKKITITAQLQDEFSAAFSRLTGSFERLVTVLDKTQTETTQLDSANRKLAQSSKAATTSIVTQTSALTTLAGVARGLISIFGTLSAGLALRGAFNQFRDFEAQMVVLQKAVDLGDDAIKRLGKDLVDFSKQAPLPGRVINDIAIQLGLLGVKGEKSVVELTKAVTEFIVAAEEGGGQVISAKDAASGLVITLTQLNEEVSRENISKFGSAVDAVADNTKSSNAEVLIFTEGIRNAFSQLKATSGEVAAFAATFDLVGVPIEKARAGIVDTFDAMLNAVSGNGFELQRFAEISGKTADQFVQDFGEKPLVALTDFIVGLSGLGDGTGVVKQNLKDLGIVSDRTTDTLVGLADSVGTKTGLVANLQLQAQAVAENTRIQTAYQAKLKTVAATQQLLTNRIAAAGIVLGEELVPAFTSLTETVERLVESGSLVSLFNAIGVVAKFAADHIVIITSALATLIALNVAASLVRTGAAFFAVGKSAIGATKNVIAFARGFSESMRLATSLAAASGVQLTKLQTIVSGLRITFAGLSFASLGLAAVAVAAIVVGFNELRKEFLFVDVAFQNTIALIQKFFASIETGAKLIGISIDAAFTGILNGAKNAFNGIVDALNVLIRTTNQILKTNIPELEIRLKISGETPEDFAQRTQEEIDKFNNTIDAINEGRDRKIDEEDRRRQGIVLDKDGIVKEAGEAGEAAGLTFTDKFKAALGLNTDAITPQIEALGRALELEVAKSGRAGIEIQNELALLQAQSAGIQKENLQAQLAALQKEFDLRVKLKEQEILLSESALNAAKEIDRITGADKRGEKTAEVLNAETQLLQKQGELNALKEAQRVKEEEITASIDEQNTALTTAGIEARISALDNEKKILDESKQILIESGELSRVDVLNQELELTDQKLRLEIESAKLAAQSETDEAKKVAILQNIINLENELANSANRARAGISNLIKELVETAQAAQQEYKSTIEDIEKRSSIGAISDIEANAQAVAALEKRNKALADVRAQLVRLREEGKITETELGRQLQALEAGFAENLDLVDRRIEETISNIQGLRSSANSAFSGFFSDIIKSGGDLESAMQALLGRLTDSFVDFLADEATNKLLGGGLDALLGGSAESKGGLLGGLLGTGGTAIAGAGGTPTVEIGQSSQGALSTGIGSSVSTGIGSIFSGIGSIFSNLLGGITQAITIAPLIAINSAILGLVSLMAGELLALTVLLIPATIAAAAIAALLIPLTVVTALLIPVLIGVAAGIPIIIGLLAGILAVSTADLLIPFAEGGQVPGKDYGRDTVPAMLRPQEFVLVPEAAKYYGNRFLDLLNRMAIPRDALIPRVSHRSRMSSIPIHGFAAGGPVPIRSTNSPSNERGIGLSILKADDEAVRELNRGGRNAQLEFLAKYGKRAIQ
jgi:hypothetical protein